MKGYCDHCMLVDHGDTCPNCGRPLDHVDEDDLRELRDRANALGMESLTELEQALIS